MSMIRRVQKRPVVQPNELSDLSHHRQWYSSGDLEPHPAQYSPTSPASSHFPESLPPETDFNDSVDLIRNPPKKEDNKEDDPTVYPSALPLAILVTGISFSAFLVALDRTIVATAIPQITDDFHAPGDVGWYGSAYLLTSCAFQPIYGRVFSHFDVRLSFLVTLGLFELGSLICGVAQDSVTFIVGRAIAGLGCAGVFAGVMVVITMSVPLAKRPMYMALVGSIFGVGSISGPIIGGAFTSKATWRWCFYLNLPVGLLTFISLVFFFHPEKRPEEANKTFGRKVLDLDLIGNFLLITSVIMLLLALQWGGIDYPWSSGRIVGLLVGAGLEGLLFVGWQAYKSDKALIPPSIVKQRTVAASFSAAFCLTGAMLVHSYYLPYWFQAITNRTAVASGVASIPYFVSNFFCAMVTGAIVTKTGYFNPPAIIGPMIAVIGCGLFTTLDTETRTAQWAGFEILAGGGIGIAIQQGIVAVQAVVPKESIPIATAIILFAQSLAGAIFVAVGNSVLRNQLESGLDAAKLPGVDTAKVLAIGATEFRHAVPIKSLSGVLHIYNDALDKVFTISIPLAGLGAICALGMEWKSLKSKKEPAPGTG